MWTSHKAPTGWRTSGALAHALHELLQLGVILVAMELDGGSTTARRRLQQPHVFF